MSCKLLVQFLSHVKKTNINLEEEIIEWDAAARHMEEKKGKE